MKYLDLAAAGMLRIGTFALYQSLADRKIESAISGAALGTCYVICRSLTSLFGKKFSRQLINELNASKKNDNNIAKIKILVHLSLWIPTMGMTYAIDNYSGCSTSLKNVALITIVSTVYALAIGVACKSVQLKYVPNFPAKCPFISAVID